MRKATLKMAEVVEQITNMRGKPVECEVNRGRKKIEKYAGVIEKVYPSVFTLQVDDETESKATQSYSFFDVLCGDVIIRESKK